MERIFCRRWTWSFHLLNIHRQSLVYMLPYVLEKNVENATIGQGSRCAHWDSSSPCSIQFCDFDLFLLKICFIECPDTIRIFKIHIDCWTKGIWPRLIHFPKKMEEIIIIIFSEKKKKNKISKNHASISKLGAFGHSSSILKKINHFFLKSQSFQNHALICRLEAFSYASFM